MLFITTTTELQVIMYIKLTGDYGPNSGSSIKTFTWDSCPLKQCLSPIKNWIDVEM